MAERSATVASPGRLVTVAVVTVIAAMWWASPALAHGADAVITVLSSESTASGVRVEVRLTYANDGDPIGGKALTATATDAAGSSSSPVEMTYTEDGRYNAEIPVPPGEYRVSIASVAPEVAIEVPVIRVAPMTALPPTTAPPLTESPSTAVSTTLAQPAATPSPDSSPTSDDGAGGSALPWVIGVVVIAAASAGVIVRARVRRG